MRHLIPTLMCGVALGVFAFAAWISYRSEAYAITVTALGFFIAVGSVTRDEITHALRQYRSRKAMKQPPFTTEKGRSTEGMRRLMRNRSQCVLRRRNAT